MLSRSRLALLTCALGLGLGACDSPASAGPEVASGGSGGSEASGTGSVPMAGGGPITDQGGNLVNAEGWVGGDPEDASDNPLGIQGAFYTYGDGLRCCQDGACEGTNPCTTGSCCFSGSTVVDGEYLAWGCGLGLELNSTGGDIPVKSAYAGDATCFAVSVSGDSGGNSVRIGFTQAADTTDQVSPFVQIPSISGNWSGTVCFADVSCPTWASEERCRLTGENYDLQIQVVGGEREGTFELCVDSVVPS